MQESIVTNIAKNLIVFSLCVRQTGSGDLGISLNLTSKLKYRLVLFYIIFILLLFDLPNLGMLAFVAELR